MRRRTLGSRRRPVAVQSAPACRPVTRRSRHSKRQFMKPQAVLTRARAPAHNHEPRDLQKKVHARISAHRGLQSSCAALPRCLDDSPNDRHLLADSRLGHLAVAPAKTTSGHCLSGNPKKKIYTGKSAHQASVRTRSLTSTPHAWASSRPGRACARAYLAQRCNFITLDVHVSTCCSGLSVWVTNKPNAFDRRFPMTPVW